MENIGNIVRGNTQTYLISLEHANYLVTTAQHSTSPFVEGKVVLSTFSLK